VKIRLNLRNLIGLFATAIAWGIVASIIEWPALLGLPLGMAYGIFFPFLERSY